MARSLTRYIIALGSIEQDQIDETVDALCDADRIFCLGNGGGYAHAMHFASDLRKIAGIEAISFDNVAEMTARINDDGWEKAWSGWLDDWHYGARDLLFLFSVGGALTGDVSLNLQLNADYGIVGERGAAGKRIVVPSLSTPVIEGCQSVIAHQLVELCK